MHQTLIFGQDVVKSKDARRVREPWKIYLHHAWPREFNTTLKLLRITDQWYIVPVKFWFGRNRDFLALLLVPLAGGPKDGKRFDADWRLISSASFHTSSLQIIVKGIRRNETATIKTVRKKPLRHWCGWGDLVQLSFVKQNLL